jgi:hypothetical protein
MGSIDRRAYLTAATLLWLATFPIAGCQPLETASQLNHLHHQGHGPDLEVSQTPTVEALAHDLDKVEAHIEKFGSVVTKQPDVWGQARLTKYRDEFETQMAAQLSTFNMSLQGLVSTTDQAYFADALALSAAASSDNGASNKSTTSTSSSSSSAPASGSASPSTQPASAAAPAVSTDVFNRNPATLNPTLPSVAGSTMSITLEPTVFLDQRARFINHLQELRRINEGDDTADSPGYSLNLVRIPVSVLPGKFTEIGYGAEVTVTMNPYLGGELLPTTFRNLVINDLTDQLGFPITEFINNPQNSAYFDERSASDLDQLINLVQRVSLDSVPQRLDNHDPDAQEFVSELRAYRWRPGLQSLLQRPEWNWVDTLLTYQKLPAPELATRYVQELKQTTTGHASIPVPSMKGRRAKLPFPPSQIFEIYGFDFARLTLDAYRAVATASFAKPSNGGGSVFLHLPDIQGYLQEELSAAHKFLEDPANCDLYVNFCTPELVRLIRGHRGPELLDARMRFRSCLYAKAAQSGFIQTTTAMALEWTIIVDSALLNDQLIQDMRESAAAKNFGCPRGDWLPYYLPCPPTEARQAFNEYVRCRWPIHVFALDPSSQQQNIVDTFSGRREMQLALSMAFVRGNLSANNMMRYSRRIEYDAATIDLNGTEIGFSHGNDTFGWRFYPRFQTPDVESNAQVFFRDLLIGGPNRNELLKQRRLEPGIRECVAIVIMPSFVPFATFNVSSNFFNLTDPKCKELDSTDAMQLSKMLKTIDTYGPRVVDGQCYRDGDLQRLGEKARQLEARLPLQSTMVQIPYENTLGGFGMFNTGVTDLSPELTGFYGTDAVDPSTDTALFLVGNHFSVNMTRIIAGGMNISTAQMLSRQVIRVTIPKGTLLVGDDKNAYVDVQLATPYGVTQHLLIPAITSKKAATGGSANAVAWKTPSIDLSFTYVGLGIVAPSDAATLTRRPADLAITPGSTDPKVFDEADVTLDFSAITGSGGSSTPIICKYDATTGAYTVSGASVAAAIFQGAGNYLGPATKSPATQISVPATVVFKSSLGAAPDQDSQPISKPLNVNFYPSPSSTSK